MTNQSDVRDVIEIDLLRLIRPVLAQWKVIVLVTALFTSSSFTVLLVRPSYVASASIAIVKTRTDVQFDSRIRTLQPDDTVSLVEYRRNALITMVSSPRIAQRTLEKFAARLPEGTTAVDLLDAVTTDEGERNDILKVNVQNQDAALAAEIATFWAKEFEKDANAVLSGITSEYVSQVDTQLTRATAELEDAQAKLLEFIRASDADSLRLLINQKIRDLDRLEAMSLAPLLGSLQGKQSSLGAVAAISESQKRVRQLKTLAEAMREQVKTGGDSAAATNVVALLNLKAQVYTIMALKTTAQASLDNTASSFDRQRATSQSQLDTMFNTSYALFMPNDLIKVSDAASQLQDLESLVTALNALEKQLGADMKRELFDQDGISSPEPVNAAEINTVISNTTRELRLARADLEDINFTQNQLQAKRDTLLGTVQALRAKRNEVDVSSGVGSSYIRLYSEAIEPIRPYGVTVRVVLALVIGLVAGTLLAIVLAVRSGAYRQRQEES